MLDLYVCFASAVQVQMLTTLNKYNSIFSSPLTPLP